MVNSRRKGARGEVELSHRINEVLGLDSAHRGQQHSGVEGKDVLGVPGLHIECKRVQKLNLSQAYGQACADADEGEVPCVMHRKDREQWLVTLQLTDLPRLCQILSELLNR